MLRGRRFVRLHPRVYVAAQHELSWSDLVRAAQLALPGRAHLTGISRLQAAGLDFGPRRPVRFVIEGDHHLALDGIFLHRTKKLPSLDEAGVTIESAYVFYCARARTLDAIRVGDWLLHAGLLDLGALTGLATSQLWRPGTDEALWVVDHLHPGARSLMESELRAVLAFAGLPAPEVNATIDLDGVPITPDLHYRRWGVCVEYEGGQHQSERTQYVADLDRYETYRRHGRPYVQLTREHLTRPELAVRRVHRVLCAAGYDGPPPAFEERWRTLFARLSTVIGARASRPGGECGSVLGRRSDPHSPPQQKSGECGSVVGCRSDPHSPPLRRVHGPVAG